ncbi:hypothetical protein [Aeromonas dhakensis]|uniref:hypothetical protein n=1 Tax=Aeromonas dhakensis TaxID=196024 RepID=UPI001F6039BE|nr:hypothetical protein [Aeromonas dhakensis]UNU87539.1 hypothetical protein GB930_04715 [Aeromonas dhakensis]
MFGIVKGLSRNKQRVAVLTDYGYTIFDIEDGEVSIGDEITGNLDDHGSQDLTNQTTRQQLLAYIEAIQVTPSAAQNLLSNI